MGSTNFNIGINNEAKLSSRVLKPPGGGTSNIFGSPEPVGNPPGKMSDQTYEMQQQQYQQQQQQQNQQHQQQYHQQQLNQQQQNQQHQQQYHQQQQQYHQQQQQYHQQQEQHIGDAVDPNQYCGYAQGEQQPPMADYPGVVRTGSNETVTSKAESVADREHVANHPAEHAEDTRSIRSESCRAASGNQDGVSADQAQYGGGECSSQVTQQSHEMPAAGDIRHANEQQEAHASGQQPAGQEIRPPTPAQPQANILIPKDVLKDDGAPPSRRRGPVKPVSRNGLNDPPPDDSTPQRRVRVPPGGFSSGLW